MAVRDKAVINLIYLHVDLSNLKSTDALRDMTTEHEGKGDWKISIGRNEANTEAIVKVVAPDDWSELRAWSDAIIRAYRESEHDLVKAIVRRNGWWPAEEVVR